MIQDLRVALRHLLKTPGFSLAAIATLALGIGATTAIFSTVNAALLRPLPYPHAENLYGVRTALTDGRVTTGLLAPSEVARLNVPDSSIVRAVGVLPQDVTVLRADGVPQKATVYGVSQGFFEMFGLPMAVGSAFTSEQFAPNSPLIVNGPPTAVIISQRIWKNLFGGDPAVLGKTVRFAEGATLAVVGVAPRDFDIPHGADFWFPLALDPGGVGHNLEGYLRIKPGASVERVRAEMASVMQGLARDFPASAMARIYVVSPLVEQIVGDLKPVLIVVLSATALLLVLASVNVTNLLLARGAVRAREMAVRVALGASRGRIVRQLLAESAILALAGGVVGVGAASIGLRVLLASGADKLPRLESVTFDTSVLLFALGTLVIAGIIVGFAPALRLAGTDVKTLMNEQGRSSSGGRATTRWLNALMVAEIALSVMLVAGAGWLVRSFANLQTVDPGFSAANRFFFDVSFSGPKYPNGPAIVAAADDLIDRVRHLNGIDAAGATANIPLRLTPQSSLFVEIAGQPFDPRSPFGSRQRIVGPGFFSAMGMKLIAGRDFTHADRADTAAVAVVNRSFVKRYLPDRDPLGVSFTWGYPTIDPQRKTLIVGVVDDVRQKALTEAPEPAFYSTDGQFPARRRTVVVHSTRSDISSLQAAIRAEVAKIDPQIAVDFTSVSDYVMESLLRQQLGMRLMLIFGATALALAAVGIYGVIAYAASQRQGEVATRLALGATQAAVFWLVVRQGRLVAFIGAAIGLVGAYLAGRVLAAGLFEVRAADPAILLLATVTVMAIALAATMIPAFRVARVDPARVLRLE